MKKGTVQGRGLRSKSLRNKWFYSDSEFSRGLVWSPVSDSWNFVFSLRNKREGKIALGGIAWGWKWKRKRRGKRSWSLRADKREIARARAEVWFESQCKGATLVTFWGNRMCPKWCKIIKMCMLSGSEFHMQGQSKSQSYIRMVCDFHWCCWLPETIILTCPSVGKNFTLMLLQFIWASVTEDVQ